MFIKMKKTLIFVIAIFIVLILVIYLWPVKTNWTEEELTKLGVVVYSGCGGLGFAQCPEGYDCILLTLVIMGVLEPTESVRLTSEFARCVPKDLNLCSTFCNPLRGCLLQETLPPQLVCN